MTDSGTQNAAEWIDVTTILNNVTQNEMTVGEMIHHPTEFSLLRVMQAIEMMDPKMDPAVTHKEPVFDLQTRIEKGLVQPINQLSAKQIIQIMDNLLCAEFTWYDGASLPQSVFSCTYLSDEHTHMDDQLMAALQENASFRQSVLVRAFVYYCKALVKGVDEVRNVMLNTDCREDEEFIYNPLGCYLGQRDRSKIVLSSLTSIEKQLSDYCEKLTSKSEVLNLEDCLQDSEADELRIAKALLARISYRNSYYNAHDQMRDPESVDFVAVRNHLLAAKKSLKQIKDSHKELFSTEREFIDTMTGFDKYLVTLYSSPSPLKAIDLLTFDVTERTAAEYLLQLEKMCSVKQHQTLEKLIAFFREFSASQSLVIVRCRLLYLLVVNQKIFNTTTFQNIIVKHLLTKTPCLTAYHKSRLENWLEHTPTVSFIDSYANCLYSLFHNLCNNRARLRRRLVQLIADLSALEIKAEGIDYNLAQRNLLDAKPGFFAFTFTTIDLLCSAMEDYVKLGFELDLYHPTEYKYVYYYLEYISTMKIANLRRLNSPPSVEDPDSSKKKKKKKAAQNTQTSPTAVLDAKEKTDRALYEIQTVMSRAILRTIAFLELNGQYPNSSANHLPFGNEARNFERRFEAFNCLSQPPVKTYEDFLIATDFTGTDLNEIALTIIDHFNGCATTIDYVLSHPETYKFSKKEIDNLKAIQKIATTNKISLSIAFKYKKNDGEEQSVATSKPVFDFTHSRIFPVIKVPK